MQRSGAAKQSAGRSARGASRASGARASLDDREHTANDRATERIGAAGFRGVPLDAAVQMLNIARQTCRLRIRAGARAGELSLEDGEVVHAVSPDCTGEDAFFAMLSWPEPHIDIEPAVAHATQTIAQPLSALLLEGIIRLDRLDQQLGSESSPGRVSASGRKDEDAGGLEPVSRTLTPTGSLRAVEAGVQTAGQIDGVLCALLVDMQTGEILASRGAMDEVPVAVAAAGLARVLRATESVARSVGEQAPEEVQIVTDQHYELARSLAADTGIALVVFMRRDRANLALARRVLTQVELTLRG